MKISQIIALLEEVAPQAYQESYDNAGLIVGDPTSEVQKTLVCLDSTEEVIDEAIALGCGLVIAHHPIVFRGLKRFNGGDYVERTIIKAIKNDIAIYAIHTNLDNVYYKGVNEAIANRLGLKDTRILQPAAKTILLSTQVKKKDLGAIQQLLQQDVFAQEIRIMPLVSPTDDLQIQLEYESERVSQLSERLKEAGFPHLSFSIQETTSKAPFVGAGLIGHLESPFVDDYFLEFLKERMQTQVIKHTKLLNRPIQRVALCGGAGSFLLKQAIRQKADIFITGDFKYHEFFDADQKIIIADIGHFESEQFTIDLICDLITNKFSNFAVYKTKVRTNPVFCF